MDNLLSHVLSILKTTPERWTSLVESLPADLLASEPAPGEWSALGCLEHLLETERYVFPARVGCFLQGQDFAAFDPDDQGSAGAAGGDAHRLVEEFSQLRADSLAQLEQLTPADLERRVRHSELGMVSLGEMLHEWAAHDLNHKVQAERALMQPFLAGCGAWKPYFAEHRFDRSIRAEAIVPAPRSEVWRAWTTEDGARTFFAPRCRIDLRLDGAYEMYFDLEDAPGKQGGEGMRLLAIQPEEMLSFTWNAPPELPKVRPQKTHVVVRLYDEGGDRTWVALLHDGWGAGAEWDAAHAYFQRVWGQVVLRRLVHRFEAGPLDWDNLPHLG